LIFRRFLWRGYGFWTDRRLLSDTKISAVAASSAATAEIKRTGLPAMRSSKADASGSLDAIATIAELRSVLGWTVLD